MTDFTVRVNKLPKVREFDALDLLSAALTVHIDKIMQGETSVFKESEGGKIKASEIVSINFAMRPFSNYKILLKIEQLVQEGQRLRTQQKNESNSIKKSKIEV